tara:strand:+ start:621 stop:884 length:264 start_codon:yes stop_codon:yes gene_type:complete
MKTFTLEKMKEFVNEVIADNGFRKICDYVMLHDKAMYKTNEKIDELTSNVKYLREANIVLIERLVFLEQQPNTPSQKSSKEGKQRSR